MGKILARFVLALAFLPLAQPAPVLAQSVQYISPAPGSIYNPVGTTIAIRYGDLIDHSTVSGAKFTVQGSLSGRHAGSAILADDQKTAIFKPSQPFTLGETVDVTIRAGMASISGKVFGEDSFSFAIRKSNPSISRDALRKIESEDVAPAATAPAVTPKTVTATSSYRTAPNSIPTVNITTPANGTVDGFIFTSPFTLAIPHTASYVLMMDNHGSPVYYQQLSGSDIAFDFKQLPNGNLAYWDQTVNGYLILNNAYQVIDTIQPGNGLSNIDFHELLRLSNGHYLFLIYDPRTVDTTQYGGSATATVIALVIQELDASKNVVFQWDSMAPGNFPLTDTYVDLSISPVDYVHGNALEIDPSDGNILLSSRHLSEITKIDHQTGAIIWRLGGKARDFTLSAAPGIDPTFSFQHDIRILPNGDITLFDNHNNLTPYYSRGMEFSLNLTNHTADLVWEFRDNPDAISPFMGNAQRFANGNTLIGWGGSLSPNFTEVLPGGGIALEGSFDGEYISYRVVRSVWHGFPTWAPILAESAANNEVQLFFSWNGATDISAYQVLGGSTDQPTTLLTTQPKTGFEETVTLTGDQAGVCFYRVMPLNLQSLPTQYSNVVINPACGMKTYLGVILR